MKNRILVFAAMLIALSCNKQARDESQLASDIPQSKVVESKRIQFYNEANKKNIPKYEKGVVLFKLKSNNSLSRVAGKSSTERVFTKAMEKSGDRGFYKVRIVDENKTLAELKKNPDVEWASLNYVETTQTTPDDPYWSDGNLWGMQHIGMPAVWESGNFGNKQVVVGVIDEGIFGHEDLCQNIWRNPHEQDNGIDDDGNGYIDDFHGWDWFNNDNEVYPGATHGTHVAGTIGAKGGNQKGVIGVNSNVTLISCKFLEGFGYDDNAVKAIDYLIDLKTRHGINIKVTSNSWGGGGYNPGLEEAIKRAREADILFVAAAGNHAGNNDTSPNYPSNYNVDNIIAVGASDWGNSRASFSCFGATTVDIFAPGTGIVSTVPNASTHTSAYAFYSGTSMATPHVAGACALYAGINPEASYQQIKAAILNNAKPIAALQGLCVTNGILDVSSFTGQTEENQAPIYDCPSITPDTEPPTVPQNFIIDEIGFEPTPGAFYGGHFRVRWDRSTDNLGVAGYVLWFNGTPTWFLGGNSYVIAGLDTSENIIAWVHAQDTWGNVSGFSNSDTVIWNQTPVPPDTQAPTLNGNPALSDITTSSIKASWPAASDNVGVTAYELYRNGVLIKSNTAVTFVDNGLQPGTTYTYFYRARDAAGNWSANSLSVSGTTLTPEPPPSTCTIQSQLEATSQSTNVALTFTATSSCAIQSTRLERKKSNNPFTTIVTNPASPYNDNVPNPGPYTYRLVITLTNGQVGYSNEKTIQVKKK